MALHILGGRLKGLALNAPPSDILRPTMATLKRRPFDALQNLDGHIFFDLCAGTGSVGLEAYSRGADCFFYEASKKVFKQYLLPNVSKAEDKMGVTDQQISTFSKDFSLGLEILNKEKSDNIILFFDPPYDDHHSYASFLGKVKDSSFKGEVWVESMKGKGPTLDNIEKMIGRDCQRLYKQGDHFLGRWA